MVVAPGPHRPNASRADLRRRSCRSRRFASNGPLQSPRAAHGPLVVKPSPGRRRLLGRAAVVVRAGQGLTWVGDGLLAVGGLGREGQTEVRTSPGLLGKGFPAGRRGDRKGPPDGTAGADVPLSDAGSPQPGSSECWAQYVGLPALSLRFNLGKPTAALLLPSCLLCLFLLQPPSSPLSSLRCRSLLPPIPPVDFLLGGSKAPSTSAVSLPDRSC